VSTKTPEENESDMEAGMTTAERRRRRRRGGGLRVPSDNVPRRISSPTVEDPSVAIAYNAGNGETPRAVPDPVAPEAVTTLIDPPTEHVIEEISFESKTREMSAVDLEELGLDAESRPLEPRTVSAEIPIFHSTVVVDADVYTEADAPSLAPDDAGGSSAASPRPASRPAIQPPQHPAVHPQAHPIIPSAAGTPPPVPTGNSARSALAPAASSPSPFAPQAPSAFGTAPGHPPPPTHVASPLGSGPSGLSGATGQGGSAPANSSSSAAGLTFSSLAAAGASSAAISPPSSPAISPPAASSGASPALGSPVSPHAAASLAPSSGVPTPVSSGVSAAVSAPVSAPVFSPLAVASAVTVPLSMPVAPVLPHAAEGARDGHANGAHVEEPPPPPRAAKGRAQTLALSEDDLEELLEENRLESRPDLRLDSRIIERVQARAERPASTNDEIGELDVEVEMDSSAVPAALDDSASWKSGRVATPAERRSDRAIGAEPASDRPTERSGELGGAFEPEQRRERVVTPLGVPVTGASTAPAGSSAGAAAPSASPGAASVGPLEGGRAKPSSIPPPTPGPAALAVPPAPPAPVQAAAASQVAQAAPHSAPPAHPAAPPPPPHVTPATSSPAIHPPGAAGSGAPGRATPPPSPTKPPPAPPKKAPDKRAAAAAAGQPEADKKSRSKQWFSDVFDEDYLRTLPFLTPQATQAEAELVAASLGTSPGAKLLDVGCGYGRHAMELAARGYHVVGLDLSTPLLVRGGEEAHRRGLTINFIRGDMRELDFDGQFDGAYCLFSTFGYFDDETNKKTAGNIARALRPGGKCVFEILNRDYVIADLPTRVWWEGDGCVVLEEVDFNYFSSRICVNRSVVFDDGRQLEQEISIRAYSLHEVGKLMLAAGFRVLEVSGSYQTRGRFFGNQSRHIIVVAERAG
jgi:SAM-dependent methyltransferase